jgi:hypothetical protein
MGAGVHADIERALKRNIKLVRRVGRLTYDQAGSRVRVLHHARGIDSECFS